MTGLTRRDLAGLAGGALFAPAPARAQAPEGVEVVRYTSQDRPIAGLMFSPVGAAAQGPMAGAAAVLLHGSGGAQDDVHLFTEGALMLASRGYRVLLPNYYDATPREGAHSGPVSNRRWRQAILDGVAWIGTRPGVDPARVGALGFSRGGGLVMDGAVRFGGPAAVVGVASAANVEVAGIVHKPPMLLIWSDHDPVVGGARPRAWADTLRQAGVEVETAALDSPRHRFDDAEWRAIFGRTNAFFERTLGKR